MQYKNKQYCCYNPSTEIHLGFSVGALHILDKSGLNFDPGLVLFDVCQFSYIELVEVDVTNVKVALQNGGLTKVTLY